MIRLNEIQCCRRRWLEEQKEVGCDLSSLRRSINFIISFVFVFISISLNIISQMSIPPPSHPRKEVRTVCVAIPYDQATDRILMVTSRKHPTKWILPKGGWEKGESLGESARREALEEAGVVSHPFKIPPTAIHVNQDHKTIYHYFHLPVLSLSVHFLEDTQRKRQWVTYTEAEERIRAWAKDDDEPDGCKRKKEMGEGLQVWKAWRDELSCRPETAQPLPSQGQKADFSTLG